MSKLGKKPFVYAKSEYEVVTNRQTRDGVCRNAIELIWAPGVSPSRRKRDIWFCGDFCERVLFDSSPAYLFQFAEVLLDLKQCCLTYDLPGQLWVFENTYHMFILRCERMVGDNRQWEFKAGPSAANSIREAIEAAARQLKLDEEEETA